MTGRYSISVSEGRCFSLFTAKGRRCEVTDAVLGFGEAKGEEATVTNFVHENRDGKGRLKTVTEEGQGQGDEDVASSEGRTVISIISLQL